MNTIMNIKTFLPVLALACVLGFGIEANAQGTSTTTPATPVTPTVPNTGTGGEAPLNLLILLGAGLVAFGGGFYLYSVRSQRG